jgi:hypothetical protein
MWCSPSLAELTKETNLSDGLTNVAGSGDFNKESGLRDIKAVSNANDKSGDLAKAEVGAILRDLKLLDEEPTMLAALQRRDLIEGSSLGSQRHHRVNSRGTPGRKSACETGNQSENNDRWKKHLGFRSVTGTPTVRHSVQGEGEN